MSGHPTAFVIRYGLAEGGRVRAIRNPLKLGRLLLRAHGQALGYLVRILYTIQNQIGLGFPSLGGGGGWDALLSAKLAVSLFDSSKHASGFPEDLAQEYMVKLWEALGPELSNSFKIQKIVKRKRLMNMFVRKAAKRPALQDALTDALASKEAQKKLHSPLWLIRNIIL